MKMLVMAALAASLLGGTSASAQVGGQGTSPLGASPLTMGSGMPVAPTGIPFGATEMTAPGISPAPSAAMGTSDCSNAGGPTSQAAAPLFDGGGTAGTASSACAGTAGAGSSMPALPTLRAGRAGIPLGSTELGDAGAQSSATGLDDVRGAPRSIGHHASVNNGCRAGDDGRTTVRGHWNLPRRLDNETDKIFRWNDGRSRVLTHSPA